jgi:hypothetical protein
MRHLHPLLAALAALLLLPSAGAAVVAGAATPGAPATRTEVRELFAEDGTIARVELDLPVGTPFTAAELDEAVDGVTPLHVGGPHENRYDLVILGDGYTAGELDLFHQHAAAHWQAIRDTEPFADYVDFFNVWLVDVVSPESGVDNDPDPTVSRDTALDMHFWCSGVERGLCVDEAKARQAAALAPAADQLLVLANSTKYGGIGGGVATASGGNSLSELIAVHELGHSLGGLADEYDYYLRAGLEDDAAQDVTIPLPYLVYPEAVLGEPSGVNTTAQGDPQAMVAEQLKWWRWVGETSPDGGVVGAYEGSGYYRFGQFRPTPDSLMHTLGSAEDPNALNLPSVEQMIAEFYEVVRPVDAAHPDPAEGRLAVGQVAALELVGPRSRPLRTTWLLDGVPRPELDGATAVTVTADLAGGSDLTAVVRDDTPSVRDPAHLAGRLTQQVDWSV